MDRAELRRFALAFGLNLSHGYWMPIAAIVAIKANLPHPSNHAAEGDRVLWTLCGVGIALLIMLLAGLLARRTAKMPPRPTPQPA